MQYFGGIVGSTNDVSRDPSYCYFNSSIAISLQADLTEAYAGTMYAYWGQRELADYFATCLFYCEISSSVGSILWQGTGVSNLNLKREHMIVVRKAFGMNKLMGHMFGVGMFGLLKMGVP